MVSNLILTIRQGLSAGYFRENIFCLNLSDLHESAVSNFALIRFPKIMFLLSCFKLISFHRISVYMCQVHCELRKWLHNNAGAEVAASTRIIYGGMLLFHIHFPYPYCLLNKQVH